MCTQKTEGASAIFYLRPGNLYKDFFVAKCTSGVDGKGRPVKKYDSDHSVVIHAVLAQATPQEKARWEQIQHPITHTIVDRGHPKAAETDQLTCGNRKFYVQGVDEPGQLGLYTIYYVEERKSTTLRMKRTLRKTRQDYHDNLITFKEANATMQSYLAMLSHVDCKKFKEKLLDEFVLTHADDNGEEQIINVMEIGETGALDYETVYC